jgi:hypothetical protein
MGAWDYGVYDDDTAYDYLPDLKEADNIIALMEQYFDDAISSDYMIRVSKACLRVLHESKSIIKPFQKAVYLQRVVLSPQSLY